MKTHSPLPATYDFHDLCCLEKFMLDQMRPYQNIRSKVFIYSLLVRFGNEFCSNVLDNDIDYCGKEFQTFLL